MKKSYWIRQEWLIEFENKGDEQHLMEVINRMLQIETPLTILKGWEIPVKQLDTVTDFEENEDED